MRIDQQLNASSLGINAQQHFFMSAWFNLVHQHSLDSYRVRVMNPLNILRELRRMADPPANDEDRKVVALEALEILRDHPVLIVNASKHPGLPYAVAFIAEAVETKEGGFKKNALLLRSFMREVEGSLDQHFLADCFTWMEGKLTGVPAGETEEQRVASFVSIERVCRDIVRCSRPGFQSGEPVSPLPAAPAQRAVGSGLASRAISCGWPHCAGRASSANFGTDCT